MKEEVFFKMSENMVTATTGRKLGLIETMYEHLMTRFSTSIYFQAVVLKSNYLFTLEEFAESLEALVNFQPLLRMKVVKEIGLGDGKENEEYFFRPCDVDVSSLISVRQKTDGGKWTDIIEEEERILLKEGFGNGAQWKVLLTMPKNTPGLEDFSHEKDGESFYEYDVVFIMQHMLADAVSSYDMVYRQFLPILNKIVNKEPPDSMFLKPQELAPSYEEEVLKLKNSANSKVPWYIRMAMSLIRTSNRMFSKNLGEPTLKSEDSPYNDAGSGPYVKVIDEQLLKKMIEMRNEKDTGIHSMLVTAFAFAFLKSLQRCGLPLPKKISGGWPIDSRRSIERFKSPQPLGIFIADSGMSKITTPKSLKIDKETFWERAKEVANGVKKHQQGGSSFKLPLTVLAYLIENLKTHENFGKLFSELGFAGEFVLSNLSKCSPGPTLEKTSPNFVDAEEMYFGLCGKGFSEMPSAFFITATNHKNKIFLTNCYNRKWISQECVQEYMEEVEKILVMACEDDVDDFEHLEWH